MEKGEREHTLERKETMERTIYGNGNTFYFYF
jgi:hypothetical protein